MVWMTENKLLVGHLFIKAKALIVIKSKVFIPVIHILVLQKSLDCNTVFP